MRTEDDYMNDHPEHRADHSHRERSALVERHKDGHVMSPRELVPELVAEVERLREARRDEGRYLVETHNERADLLRENERLRAAIERAKAVLPELESGMQSHVEAFANGAPKFAEMAAAAARVVGAKRVLAALEADR
ncbi:hypothetical protein SEA_NAIRB_53 [Mycobacterium phage Nairb]|uniref:Uncharacterized protein n=3 Tax=Bernalvirus bernal13 TaxID=1982102 RepID=A0A2P1JRU2_9CAUD|nr:hypothetical protein FH37_gp53 [Mycobacterium phage Bernal13]AHY26969.1 hypothetical protein PBI_BERNAL13_54 [Mycobacterium phage Bernal13]AVO21841.1 hypothetical protein SEA_NAIRB_53 [Mycobacterium phage Nairb]QHB47458.1 hypothetical protein SEA_WHITTY_53 [Mycobacterium phage Whitty]